MSPTQYTGLVRVKLKYHAAKAGGVSDKETTDMRPHFSRDRKVKSEAVNSSGAHCMPSVFGCRVDVMIGDYERSLPNLNVHNFPST